MKAVYPEGEAMDEPSYGYGADAVQKRQTTLDEFDRAIEAQMATIEELGRRLTPVLSIYDSPETVQQSPRAEPSSPLRGRVDAVNDNTARIRRFIEAIDL